MEGYAIRNPDLREQLRADFPGIQSAKIKADVQILATALSRRAEMIYTHDGALTAGKGID